MLKRYTGTPEFSEPVFIYKDGKFQTTYQTFDEPCEGATDSNAIIANLQRELAERESVLERGRDGILSERSPSIQITQKNSLYRQLAQERFGTIGAIKRFWDHPMERKLATQLILSSDELLSKLADMMWARFASTPEMDDLFLPRDDNGFDVRAILNGSDAAAIEQVLKSYDVVLSQKARTMGLTKIERFLKY